MMGPRIGELTPSGSGDAAHQSSSMPRPQSAAQLLPKVTLPKLDSAGGALWLLMVGAQANRSLNEGDLDGAEATYQIIRRKLEDSSMSARDRLLVVFHHQLGIVAQHRGQLEQAEQWYQKSLEITEALGNRPGMASTYGQLGLLSEKRQDFGAALDWIVRCVALFEEFPHPATGPV